MAFRLRIIEQTIRRALRRGNRQLGRLSLVGPKAGSPVALVKQSGLLDPDWYLNAYDHVRVSGTDPVRHYLKRGATEYLDPGPSFDTDWYAAANDLLGTTLNPLLHYETKGRHEGARPNPFFDPARWLTEDGAPIHPAKMPHDAKVHIPNFDPLRPTVLVASHDASRTGAPAIALSIVRELKASQKYNVISLLINGGELEPLFASSADYLIGPFHLNRRLGFDFARLGAFLSRLATPVHLAIANSIESRAIAASVGQKGIPVVSLIHEFLSTTRPRTDVDGMSTWSDEIVFPASLVQEDAEQSFPFLAKRKTFVAPQGPSIIPQNDTAEQRTLAGKGHAVVARQTIEEKIIVGAGYASFRKGLDLFIDTARELKQLDPGRRFRFIWFGDGFDPVGDQNYGTMVEDQAKRSDVADEVVIFGPVPNLEELYGKIDILFLSSRLDPLPNVALDAMRNGVPVVCFDRTTGFVDVLGSSDDTSGCVVPYLDTAAAAKTIERLLVDQELYARTSVQVRALADRLFDNKKYVATLEEIGARAIVKKKQKLRDADAIEADAGFDSQFYLGPYRSGDRKQSISAFVHEWAGGALTRKPCAGFNSEIFASENALDFPVNPFAEYIRRGRPAGAWSLPIISPLTTNKKSKPPALRIALHLHAHFPEGLPEILDALALNGAPCDLIITADTQAKLDSVGSMTASYRGGHVVSRLCPNRGRDIAPFLDVLRSSSSYDLVGHLHSKRSPHLSDRRMVTSWNLFLLGNLIGASHPMMARIVDAFAADDRLGLVFPDDPHILQWGPNAPFAKLLAKKMNISIDLGPVDFPAGTMFWARPAALAPLLMLEQDDFPPEPIPIDGSPLHALERMLPAIANSQGYTCAVTHVSGLTR